MVQLELEFAGGLDLLTADHARRMSVSAPVKTMGELITWVRRNKIREKHDMFALGDGAIRPGVLVLVNDADWELEDTTEYRLQEGDRIAFISTLHGG